MTRIMTYGKWILAGEHSVLRGSPALVFPLKSKSLELIYGEQGEGVCFGGTTGKEYEILFRTVLEKSCDLLKIDSRELLRKKVTLLSNLPVGTGLGASAAFCVTVVKLFHSLGYLRENELYDFALKLENLFHGESSGVDLAVCLQGTGLLFERSGKRDIFAPRWTPHLYVSYTGQRGMTYDCVRQVKDFISRDSHLGMDLDQRMKEAVLFCAEAMQGDSSQLPLLQKGIQQAATCFQGWGLDTGGVRNEMERVLQAGALAVKPTGSGGGGYVLSLWEQEPVGVSGLSRCF